jgi:hypothetical protein
MLSFVAVVLPVSISLSARAEDPNTAELSLRRQLQERISLGDYAAAETLLHELEAMATVTAKPAGNTSPAPALKIKETSFFDWMANAGFVLQRAAGNSADADPAEFSFLRNFQSESTTYVADFFLSFSPNRIMDSQTNNPIQSSYHPFGLASDLKTEASVEAKLTSESSSETNDAWRFRLSGTVDTSSIGGLVDSTYTTISFKSESDQHFDSSRLSAEIWFTPTKANLGIGRYQPQPATRYPILFRWRPYIGVDLGGTVAASRSAQNSSDQRVMFRTTATLLFPYLAKDLRLSQVSLFADNYLYYLCESGIAHDYLTIGSNFMFNKNVGFKLTFRVGDDAPQFTYEQTIAGALSMKF